jgi:DNA-binding MarR family transcriptional regulator
LILPAKSHDSVKLGTENSQIQSKSRTFMVELFGPESRSALSLWRDVTALSLNAHEHDLTARQTAILLTIYLEPGPHTVRGIAGALGLGKPAVVRALDTLESGGLLSRAPDPNDRRSVFLERTQGGAARLADLAGLIAAQAAKLTRDATESALPTALTAASVR